VARGLSASLAALLPSSRQSVMAPVCVSRGDRGLVIPFLGIRDAYASWVFFFFFFPKKAPDSGTTLLERGPPCCPSSRANLVDMCFCALGRVGCDGAYAMDGRHRTQLI